MSPKCGDLSPKLIPEKGTTSRHKKLRAIFFDIDDTLYSTSEFARTARLNSIRAMIEAGLKVKEEECFHELSEVIEEFGSNFEHHYDKLLVRLPPETYRGVNPAIIIAAGMVAYHETKCRDLKPYPEVEGVLQILAQKRLVLGIITAGLEIKQAEKLIRLKLLPYIHKSAIFITGQMGIGKQNPKLYQTACDSLGIPPNFCMYVGDNPVTDIDLPNQLGMITVLNRRSGKYLNIVGQTKPRYIIHEMRQLLGILEQDFNLTI